MRISDWSSDVCSSDLCGDLEEDAGLARLPRLAGQPEALGPGGIVLGVGPEGRRGRRGNAEVPLHPHHRRPDISWQRRPELRGRPREVAVVAGEVGPAFGGLLAVNVVELVGRFPLRGARLVATRTSGVTGKGVAG